ncbi:MAG: GvpL/GvpF family gas vesicle protein [Gallionella sp.]
MTIGKYIYAVIDAVGEKSYEGATGLNGAPLHVITQGALTAVVSDLVEKRIRPERKNLAAHNATLKRLMEDEIGVLPVKFGTLASSSNAVKALLAKNNDTLLVELAKVRGRVEMGLRVKLDVPNVFEYMVNSQSELAALRDRVYNKQHGPSQMDQIELGSAFDRFLNRDRERYTAAVIDVLSTRCADIKQNPPRDGEVMNLACLVQRDGLQAFEDGVCQAANLFDNNFSFDFNGPWAPHNFVDVNLTEADDVPT